MYSQFDIAKRSGKVRTITAPDGRLRIIQSKLAPLLGQLYRPSPSMASTPDAVPVISAVDRASGCYIATGFSGHGFGLGPAAGRLAADVVTGAPTVVDPKPFRLSRFFDGTQHEATVWV